MEPGQGAKVSKRKKYYGYTFYHLANYNSDKGGPLFFEQYTFQGIDPRGLIDSAGNDYFAGENHTLINRAYCMENPHHLKVTLKIAGA